MQEIFVNIICKKVLVLERMNYQTNVKEQSKTSHLFNSFCLDSYIQDA